MAEISPKRPDSRKPLTVACKSTFHRTLCYYYPNEDNNGRTSLSLDSFPAHVGDAMLDRSEYLPVRLKSSFNDHNCTSDTSCPIMAENVRLLPQ